MAEEIRNEQEIEPVDKSEKKEKPGFGQIWQDVKKRKRLYMIVLPLVFVLAAVYSLGKPNYYVCKVMLAPEISGSNRSAGSLSSLASTFGINLGNANTTSDALRPDLYPELMNSVSFLASLFDIKVHRIKEDSTMTYYDYLLKGQKEPWWSEAQKAVLSLIFGKEDTNDAINGRHEVNTFKLTKKQMAVAIMIGKRVMCDVDKKSYVITISVTDQDPLIAATIADSVQQKLQDFITDYRTSKARIDVEHYQALEAQAKERYEKALSDYAYFRDHNQKIFLESVRSQQSKLENELQLQQQAYMQIAAQLQLAEAKLQEEKPAFTTLQPATVPLRKAGPSRAKICLIWLFLAFLGTTVYVLHKEGHLIPLFMGSSDDEEEEK